MAVFRKPERIITKPIERDEFKIRRRNRAVSLLRRCRKKYGKDIIPVLRRLELAPEHHEDILEYLSAYGPKKVAAAMDDLPSIMKPLGIVFRDWHIDSYCKIYDHLARARALPGKVVKQTFIFEGDVQDVGFRSWAKSFAAVAGLKCIEAENLNTGGVRVVLKGPSNYQEAVLNGLKEMFKVSKITRE